MSAIIEAKRVEVSDYEENKLAELYDNNLISKQQLLSIYNVLKNKIDIINNNTNAEYVDNKFKDIDGEIDKNRGMVNRIDSKFSNEVSKIGNEVNELDSKIYNESVKRSIDVNNLINFIVKENNERIIADDNINFELKRYADRLNIDLLQTVDDVAGGMKSVNKKLEEMKDNSIMKTDDVILDYNKKIKASIAEINECYISDKVRIIDKIDEVNVVPIEVKNEKGDWENITNRLGGSNNSLQRLTVILLIIIISISVIIGIGIMIVLSKNLVKLVVAIMIISVFMGGIGYIIKKTEMNKLFDKI
jgi:hypothetical protein